MRTRSIEKKHDADHNPGSGTCANGAEDRADGSGRWRGNEIVRIRRGIRRLFGHGGRGFRTGRS